MDNQPRIWLYDRVGTGDKIKGVYFDVPFTGRVENCRFNGATSRVFYVRLENAINVFGRDTNYIALEVDSNSYFYDENNISEVLERVSNVISY